MSYLDRKMVFKEEFIQKQISEAFEYSSLKRIDDFEFTLELKPIEISTKRLRKEITDKIVMISFRNFWENGKHQIEQISYQEINLNVDKDSSVSIDVFLIESNSQKIMIELFMYQGTTNNFSIILEVSKIIN